MKLSQVKVKIITNATLPGLETDVNAFTAAAGEKTLIGEVRVFIDDGTYVAILNYTE